MSASVRLDSPTPPCLAPARGFLGGALAVATAAALLAGWAPLAFSMATVFLFAGPHNWLELRYFLTRMPARWGRLGSYFLLSFSGIAALTAGFAGLGFASEGGMLPGAVAGLACVLLDTLLVLWVATLAWMRSRQNPRRDWGWVWPVAFVLIGLAWLAPVAWGLALVYLHPLLAFWLLDRELRRSRPAWRRAFHVCLLSVPLFVAVLCWRLGNAPALEDGSELARAISQHAGAGIVPFSSGLLVATHTFLETLHYGVWVLAMPLVGLRAAPWRLESVPLTRRGHAWRWGVSALLVCGLAVVLALWACFLADYPTTRSVYFTLAVFHVLAEFPFLLRAL
jgi:hypothetical protein